MQEHKHDIAVVGAGPGGSAAAYFLARHGFDVALIDKAAFPRDKTCGDGVSPRALHVLSQMGLLEHLTAASYRVNFLDFFAPNGVCCPVEVPRMKNLPPFTLIVPRFKLDDTIRRRAVEAGAAFHQMEVTGPLRDGNRIAGVYGEGRAIAAKLTLIATGAATGLLERCDFLPRKPTVMVAARQYFEDLPRFIDRLEFYFDRVPLPGYAWVFPTSPTTANIGIGYLGKQRHSPRSLLEEFYKTHPRVRDLIRSATPVGPIKGYPLRIDFPESIPMVEGALAVGEAVGLVNPFTGEGIDYALESGQIAAECIAAAPNFSPRGLRDYPRRLNARFRHLFVVTIRLRNAYYNTFMLNRLFGSAARSRYIRDTIINVCFGDTDPLAAVGPRMLWEMFRP
ncbi:MAG: geranylgeranyl reductase family protein [Chloroflexi bacterium]|nr:geranylgeranyl reductase family protein [Chloroflexota bacterium]